MKKIIATFLNLPILSRIRSLRSVFSRSKVLGFVRSSSFRSSLKTIGLGASTSVLASVIASKLINRNNSESSPVSLSLLDPQNPDSTFSVLASDSEVVRRLRQNITLLSDRTTNPEAMKIRNELVHDFILLIGWNLAPEESHRLLTFTETLVACALSGTFPQEQAKSDTLLRFTIEEGENTISVEEADFRVQKVLNLALSGAPLV